MNELAEVKQELDEVKADIKDIKDNHLVSLLNKLVVLEDKIDDKVSDLRWFIMASLVVLGLVLGMLQVYG